MVLPKRPEAKQGESPTGPDRSFEYARDALGFEDFIQLQSYREYVINNWLLAHGMTGIIASRGTGKSTIALDIGCHLATDRDWWGSSTQKDWCVIYLCLEDEEGMILNGRAWAKHHEIAPSNDRFLFAGNMLRLNSETRVLEFLDRVAAWVNGRRCVIILDTWGRAVSGLRANAQEEMDIAVERAEMMAEAFGGPMLVCYHPPKDGRMTIRGSAVQEDTSSGLWNLEKEQDGSVKLINQRTKGRGEGVYTLFRTKTVVVGDIDEHGESTDGIVPYKVGGSEEDKRLEEKRTEDFRLAMGWLVRLVDEDDGTRLGKPIEPNLTQISARAAELLKDKTSNLCTEWKPKAHKLGIAKPDWTGKTTVRENLERAFWPAKAHARDKKANKHVGKTYPVFYKVVFEDGTVLKLNKDKDRFMWAGKLNN